MKIPVKSKSTFFLMKTLYMSILVSYLVSKSFENDYILLETKYEQKIIFYEGLVLLKYINFV